MLVAIESLALGLIWAGAWQLVTVLLDRRTPSPTRLRRPALLVYAGSIHPPPRKP